MKTVEDAAQESRISPNFPENLLWDAAFKAGVEFAESWIPVEEEMPEENVLVLCINPFSPFVATYHGKEKGFRIPNVEGEYIVTHWRPINRKA